MRITLVFLFFTLSSYAFAASDENKRVYIEFEAAYMSNDADRFSEWLAEDYEIKQTLHIPGVGADYRPVTKEQLIASMRRNGKPSSFPRSEQSTVIIETKDETKFCGSSSTENQTKVRGKDYQEKEKRKVCFRKDGNRFLAVEHSIDVYFIAM